MANDHSKAFSAISFVVAPCVETETEVCRCADEDAQFWTLYCVMPIDGWSPQDDLDGEQRAVADFDTKDEALALAQHVRDGRPVYLDVFDLGYVPLPA